MVPANASNAAQGIHCRAADVSVGGREGPERMLRRAIVVLGIHRSGMPALTRIIGLLGAGLPRTLMPPTVDNPRPGPPFRVPIDSCPVYASLMLHNE